MALKYPNGNFYGVDIDAEALSMANEEAKQLNLPNVKFVNVDLCNVPANHQLRQTKFDLITAFMVVHDLPHPQQVKPI